MAKTNRAIAPAAGLQISQDLALPIDAVTQRFAWMGRTGSGKSYGAQKLAELMLEAGAQIVVFDIPGQWHGLRLGPKPFAIPVFGGVHGDIPLEPAGGAAVADLVVARGISVVLDLSQMDDEELWSFTADFNERFFVLKQRAPSPVHVYYDECHELVPQEWERAQKRCFRSVNRQQKRGRALGIGVSLISQRPQEVSKKVLDQAECVFAFQMRSSLERESIANGAAATGSDKKMILQTLATLPVGSALVFSPQWLGGSQTVNIAQKRSPDVSATPKVGDRNVAPMALSPVDLQDLRASMEAAIERAEHDDPAHLRERIAKLEAQLRKKPGQSKNVERAVVPPEPKPVLVPVLSEADREMLARVAADTRTLSQRVDAILQRVSCKAAPQPRNQPLRAPKPESTLRQHTTPHAESDDRRRSPKEGRALGDGERKILIAAAQHQQGVTREQLTILTGYKRSTRDTYVHRLRGRGFLVEVNGNVTATPDGIAALGGDYEPLPIGSALRDHWLHRLPSGESAVLSVLVEAFPNVVSRDDISQATGFKRSTRDTYIHRLGTRKLVSPMRDGVVASDVLFD